MADLGLPVVGAGEPDGVRANGLFRRDTEVLLGNDIVEE